jgi:general stress protein 26
MTVSLLVLKKDTKAKTEFVKYKAMPKAYSTKNIKKLEVYLATQQDGSKTADIKSNNKANK